MSRPRTPAERHAARLVNAVELPARILGTPPPASAAPEPDPPVSPASEYAVTGDLTGRICGTPGCDLDAWFDPRCGAYAHCCSRRHAARCRICSPALCPRPARSPGFPPPASSCTAPLVVAAVPIATAAAEAPVAASAPVVAAAAVLVEAAEADDHRRALQIELQRLGRSLRTTTLIELVRNAHELWLTELSQ